MSRSDVQITKVYVGGLPPDARKEELEREFERYGKLHDVWVARNPPGFAFVEFFDSRDAKQACKEMDGSRLFGSSDLKVELSHGRSKGGGRGRGGGGRPGRDRYGGRDSYDRGSRYDDDDRYNHRSRPSIVVRSRSPRRRGYSPGQQRVWRSRSRSPGGPGGRY